MTFDSNVSGWASGPNATATRPTSPYASATVSGANTNFDRLRYISERTEIGERREAVLMIAEAEALDASGAVVKARVIRRLRTNRANGVGS